MRNGMEDLAPLIFFLIIVVVNLLKFFIEKGGKAKQVPGQPPRRQPSGLELFLEKLAEQSAPQPRVTPDYVQEMRPFKQARFDDLDEDEIDEIPPLPDPVVSRIRHAEPLEIRPLARHSATVPVVQRSGHAMLSGSHGLRMPGNTFISSSTAGQIDFRIDGKQALRKAMLAHVVFSPPRAYDLSFDNTIAKQGQV